MAQLLHFRDKVLQALVNSASINNKGDNSLDTHCDSFSEVVVSKMCVDLTSRTRGTSLQAYY